MDLSNLVQQVVAQCRALGKELLTQQKELLDTDISSKGVHDLVTKSDKYAEKVLVEFLSDLVPEAGFIAEEGTSTKKGENYTWIIDPIDGTTNFIHGLPCFSISIALATNERVVLGVVYEMNLDEAFYATQNSGAFLNGIPISVSVEQKMDNALIATGFPYTDFGKTEDYLNVFKYFMKNSRGLRRLGSAAVDLAYVAAGRFEGFYEYGLNPWDVAAGTFIVEEAGGLVTDFEGRSNFIFGKQLVAANPYIHNHLLSPIKRMF